MGQTSRQSVTHDETWNTASQNAITSTETNKTDRSEICVSPSWHKDDERKKQKKEMKRMEREKRELERRLKKLEEADSKRDSRSPKRGSRRLTKKQPLSSSSRASSVKADESRSSHASRLSIFSGSTRASRSSSINGLDHGNPERQSTEITRLSTSHDSNHVATSTMPRLSNALPERFGAAISKELAPRNTTVCSSHPPTDQSQRSLHSTTKSTDLRGSARLLHSVDKEEIESKGNTAAFYQTPNQTPAENGYENNPSRVEKQKHSMDLDRRSFAAALNREKRVNFQEIPKKPNFTRDTEEIRESFFQVSETASTSRPVFTRNIVKDFEEKEKGTFIDLSRASQVANSKAKISIYSLVRPTDANHVTAIIKTSTLTAHTPDCLPRNSMLQAPNGSRSHTRFRSSPLAAPGTTIRDLERYTGTNEVHQASQTLSLNQVPTGDLQDSKSKAGKQQILPLRLLRKEKGTTPDKSKSLSQSDNSRPSGSIHQSSKSTESSQSLDKNSRTLERNSFRNTGSSLLTNPSPASAGNLMTTSQSSGQFATLSNFANSRGAADPTYPSENQASLSFENPLDSQTERRPTYKDPAASVSSTTNGPDTSQKRVHSPQQSISPRIPEPNSHRITIGQLTSRPGNSSSRNSSPGAVSEDYNTALENMSTTAESLEQIPSFQFSTPTPPGSMLNVFDESVPFPPASTSQINNARSLFHFSNNTASAMHSTASLATSGSCRKPRNPQQARPLAKIFVICCHCKFWHDMPSEVYAKLAFPDSCPDSQHHGSSTTLVDVQGDSRGSRHLDRLNNLGSKNVVGTGDSALSARLQSKTAFYNRSSVLSSAPGPSVTCCWCDHAMTKSCCEGWTTIVYMHERHH